MSRDTLKRLADPQVVAVRCKGDGWPRGLLGETLIPDAWMGLVVRPDARRRFVPAGEDPRPERDDTLVLVRNRAITVAFSVTDVPAADDHAVNARVEMLLRCAPRDDDLAAFLGALVSGDELTLGGLTAAANQAGAAGALQRFIRARPAEQLVREDLRDALLEFMRTALQRLLFSAGLVIERLGQIEFGSVSFVQQAALARTATRRVQELETRGIVERAALAATHRRLDELGDILSKLKSAATADGSVQWRALLPTLTASERGRLLENLWRLTPDRATAQAIVLVAGLECVWLAPAQPERIAQRVTLPGELGGLRSVAFDAAGGTLLIGAASGVWRISATDGRVLASHNVPVDRTPRTGFNAASSDGKRVFATHSQLGAWSWSLADPAEVQPLLQPLAGVPRTIRGVTTAGGQVLLAADEVVHVFSPRGQELWQSGAADGSIQCLAVLENQVYVGTARGALQRCDLQLPGQWTTMHRTRGAIESIHARRWDDLTELVIPAGAEGVCGVYAEEGIVARLMDVQTPVRRAWACDDALVALSEPRDRLIVLNGCMPARTGRDVPLARLLGTSIQDACIVARPGEAGVSPAGDGGARGVQPKSAH